MNSARDSWPIVSPRVRELFRRGAELALTPTAEDYAKLHHATLAGLRSPQVVDDPTLFEATNQVNIANLRHWAACNVSKPGERVPPYLGPEAVDVARDLVRRGLDSRALDAYRTAQSVAWRLWMDICFTLTKDAAELKELLEVSALSISAFLDDTIDAVSARVEADLHDLTRGTNAERMATLALILEGAPITQAHAESRLGYRLAGHHTAAVIWSRAAPEDESPASEISNVALQLQAVADALMRGSGCQRRLTLVASARSLWVWLPAGQLLTGQTLTAALAAAPDVRVAIGRSGRGLDGFRRSHLDATGVQRLLARTTSTQRVARYEDVQLVALMTTDLSRADEFVADTLGDLARADPDIRETVSVYIREQFNATAAARRLYTHRNTVLRRLDRADQLLPRPLADNVTNVAAALEVLRVRPSPG